MVALLHLLGALGLLGTVRKIRPVVLALDLLDHLLHLLALAVPLFLAHLRVPVEQLGIRLPVATAEPVPEGGVLAVVVVERKVMDRVARGAVDERAVGHVLAVVDHDGPDVDEDEERDVGKLLQREQEGEDVVGHRLGVAVERVERVRGERRRHDPAVVRLVQVLVHQRMVQPAVDPVDEEVGEGEEERELRVVVPRARALGRRVIHLAVSAHLGDEEGHREDGHDGQRDERLPDLLPHLVLQVFRVVEGRLVEDEHVGERCADEVDDGAEEPVF